MCFHAVPSIALHINGEPELLYSFKHFLMRNLSVSEELAVKLLQKWIDTVPEKLHLTYPGRNAPSKPNLTRNTLVGSKSDILTTLQNLRVIYSPIASFLISKGIPVESDSYVKTRGHLLKICELCGKKQCILFKAWDGKWKVPAMYSSYEDEEYGGWYVCNDCV
jgi:hypothetical protein